MDERVVHVLLVALALAVVIAMLVIAFPAAR
jgi:hypothetical protein